MSATPGGVKRRRAGAPQPGQDAAAAASVTGRNASNDPQCRQSNEYRGTALNSISPPTRGPGWTARRRWA